MVVTFFILIIIVLVLLFRLLFIQTQLRHMTAELRRIRIARTKERVSITFGNRTIEQLAQQLNFLIDDKLESQRETIRTERQLTEMIASMSHDLRTPLTAIIGYIQLLEKETINSEKRTHYITIIKTRAKQLHALIQSFFSLSTLQENNNSLHLEPIQIDTLIKQSTLAYYDSFKESEKTVQINMPKITSTIIGDKIACQRIIENILLNTIQHAADKVTIQLLESKDTALFNVQNTVDITNHPDPARIFERLYTADTSRQTHRGLGLPIVKQLMKQMDGHVFVEIDKNTFSITCVWEKIKTSITE